MIKRSQLHEVISQKIRENGFSEIEINLETDLLSEGYLDSLDIAEILFEVELLSNKTFKIPSEFHSDQISYLFFYRLLKL